MAVTKRPTGNSLPYDRVVVLAVAVEEYQNLPKRPAITRVAHAKADAEAFVRTVRQIYEGLVPIDELTLINSHATLTTIENQARYIITNLAPQDLFLFYYAGHGFQAEGSNRLTAYDSNPSNLAESTIDLNDVVLARIRDSACSRALMFIDACAEKMKSIIPSRSLIFDLNDDEIEEELESDDYLAVFLSCSSGEKSYSSDALGHGIFTHHLLHALRGDDPRALESDRWLTDVSLRDWLRMEVSAFVTNKMTVRGHQTPRAILNTPQTFRIRHVAEPSAPSAATLADLGLRNTDAFLESVDTGQIRSLPGFIKSKHRVPTEHFERASAFVENLMKEDLETELDDLFAAAKRSLGFGRREGDVSWGDGGGGVDTPAFRYSVLCHQDPDDSGGWRVQRRLELRDGWDECREEIEEAVAGFDFDRFVIEFEKRNAPYEEVADTLEALAQHEGDFDERRSEKILRYSRDEMTIVFDFEEGRVEMEVGGESNLRLVDSTRRIALGWNNPSPMLPATRALARSSPHDVDSVPLPPDKRGIKKVERKRR